MTRGRAGSFGVAVATLLLLAACGADTSSDPEGLDAAVDVANPAPGASMPAIYLDQRIEILDQGRNQLQRNYEFAVQTCRESGQLKRALTDEDAAKIGTMRLQRWIKSGQAAYRMEEYGYSSGSIELGVLCDFHLTVLGVHDYFDDNRTVSLDLETNQKTFSDPEPDVLGRGQPLTLDEALEMKATAIAAHGPPVKETAVGEPCLRWRGFDDVGTACIWSGGTQWGFDIGSGLLLIDHPSHLLHSIVLQQEPGSRGNHRVTTLKFVIGADFDAASMQPSAASSPGSR